MAPIGKTANEIVFETLRRQILHGALFPGTWLREQDLVEQLNVSRTPIREALRRLESEGLVEIVPYRGARVVALNAEDFREEDTVRAALEGFEVELAVATISDETVERLKRMADEMERLLDERNLEEFLEINRRFHMTIYNESGSRRLVSVIKSSWERENLYRLVFLSIPAAFELEKTIHRERFEACRSRDAEQARKIMQRTLMETATLFREWSESEKTEENI